MEDKSTFKGKVKAFLSGLAEKAGSVETSLEIEITLGNDEVESSLQELPDLESLTTHELYELRNEVQEQLDDLLEEKQHYLDEYIWDVSAKNIEQYRKDADLIQISDESIDMVNVEVAYELDFVSVEEVDKPDLFCALDR